MATANPNLEGINLLSLEELTSYDPNGYTYVVLDGQDYCIRIDVLVKIIQDAVVDAQIPENVVRETDMEEYVTERLRNLPAPALEVTDANLGQKVDGLKNIVDLKALVKTIENKVTALAPANLEKAVNVDPQTPYDRIVVVTPNKEIRTVDLGSPAVIHVCLNPAREGKTKAGTLDAPFMQVQEALDYLKTKPELGSPARVIIHPSVGGVDYEGFNIDSFFGLEIAAYSKVRIKGPVNNYGAGGAELVLKNLTIVQKDATTPAYRSTATMGNDRIENVTFLTSEEGSLVPLVVLNKLNGTHDFVCCEIHGHVSIEGQAGIYPEVRIRDTAVALTSVTLNSNVQLGLYNNRTFGYVEQTDGQLIVDACRSFIGKNDIAINSTGGEVSLSFSNFQKADGDYLKIKRNMEATPVRITNCNLSPVVGVTGPVSYQETRIVERLISPTFALTVPASVDGVRQVKVERLATKGYYYDTLDAKIVQVATGTKPEDGDNTTNFTLAYADKVKTVEVPVGPGLNEIYLVLKDPNNGNATFTFGPYNN